MSMSPENSKEAVIVAVPETAGSALYGMVDVLASAGRLWQQLVGVEPESTLISPKVASPIGHPFECGNGIPVKPDLDIKDHPTADIVILPEMWLAPNEDLRGRYPDVMEWIRQRYRDGSSIYSACSGAIMLAETGLLDGRKATSHWGYQSLFRVSYPKVQFEPEPNLCFADPSGRIVTAGGTSSWHDLAIHIISKHCSTGEALRIAKVYLLKWHNEGQLPFETLVRHVPHADAMVRRCEEWLSDHYRETDAVSGAVTNADAAERTVKRRFKAATGTTLMDYVQNLRIEEAKRLLESSQTPFDTIAAEVGYENPGFFRRLFKRRTGLTPSNYRKMFQSYTATI